MSTLKDIAKDFGVTPRMGLVGLGMAAIVSVFFIAKCVRDRHYAATGPGELRGIHLIHTDGHSMLVVGEFVHYEGRRDSMNEPRLELVDPHTGEQRAHVQVPVPTQCVAASAGLLWCDSNLASGSVLELRDAATLAIHTTHAKILAAGPPLSNKGFVRIDATTREAWLPTSDGRFWHVAPDTLKGAIAEQRMSDDGTIEIGPAGTQTTGATKRSPGYMYFAGTPRSHLEHTDGYETKTDVSPEVTYIEPSFVAEDTGALRADPAPLTLDGGKLLLVVYRDNVDQASANMLISAIDLTGKIRWTAALGHGELAGAWVVDELLVLAIRAMPRGLLTGLDTSTGRTVWQHGT